MTTYLLAGGGTAGHVNPLLALADEISLHEPTSRVIALGTNEGLEKRLVPARGYELITIAKVPFPRKISIKLFTFLPRLARAVAECRKVIRENHVSVVVGFGGYASAPAYLAAALERVPLVIHEANALAGLANRLGAGIADKIAVTFAATKLRNAVITGMPLRREIANLVSDKPTARSFFGLEADQPTLLVTGGSLGARHINQVISDSRPVLAAAGIQVLHIVGDAAGLEPVSERGYVRITYCDRMDLAIDAADFAVARAGASTVSEFSALGLPALYVPYPVGNGEQVSNIAHLLDANASLMTKDAAFSVQVIANELVPLISNTKKLKEMSDSAKRCGRLDGTQRLFELVKGVLSA